LWEKIKKIQPPAHAPAMVELLQAAADVRDCVRKRLSMGRFGPYGLKVCINPSQPFTTPVLSELRCLAAPGSKGTYDEQLVSVAAGAPGTLPLSPEVIRQLRESIAHRASHQLTLTTDPAGDSLIFDLSDPRDVPRLPGGLRKLVDRFLLEPGIVCAGERDAQAVILDTPHLRAQTLYVLLSGDFANAGADESLDSVHRQGSLAWDRSQLATIRDLAFLASDDVRSALQYYLFLFSELHGREVYSHSERLMHILTSRPDCALPPLIQRLNAAARELSTQIAAGAVTDQVEATFWHVEFRLRSQEELDGAESASLIVSPERIISDQMSSRAITVVLGQPQLNNLLAAQSSSSPAVTEFVAQINSEVVRVIRNASHPQDVDAEAEAVEPHAKWSFQRVWGWLVNRYKEVRGGAVDRDTGSAAQELWELTLSDGLQAALGDKRPRSVVCDRQLAPGTTRFDVTLDPLNGPPQRYAQANIVVRLAPDVAEELAQTRPDSREAFDGLLASAQALRTIVTRYLEGPNKKLGTQVISFTVSDDQPVSVPYSVQVTQDQSLDIRCLSGFVKTVNLLDASGCVAPVWNGFWNSVYQVHRVHRDANNELFDVVSIGDEQARLPFDLLSRLRSMSASLAPVPQADDVDEQAPRESSPPITLETLVGAYFRGELVSDTSVFQQAVERYGEHDVVWLVERLSHHTVSPQDLLRIAVWMDKNEGGLRGLSDAERIGYLFEVQGSAAILDSFNLNARQLWLSESVTYQSRVYWRIVALPDGEGCRVWLGDFDEEGSEFINRRPVCVGFDKATLTALLDAQSLDEPLVSKALSGVSNWLTSHLRLGESGSTGNQE